MATSGPVAPIAVPSGYEDVVLNDAGKKDLAKLEKADDIRRFWELAKAIRKADEVNKTRTGKGTRVHVGQTRGKGTQVISWEAFDEGLPDTLPKSTQEFLEVVGQLKDEVLTSMLIDGFNAQAYSAASDPIGEYVNPAWPDDVQKGFKLVVRNFANNTGMSIEDAVAIVKPPFEKAQSSK